MSGVEDMIHAAEMSLGLPEPNYIQDWYRSATAPPSAATSRGATRRSPTGRGTRATSRR